MGEVSDIGCLVETIMVSNANQDGAEIEAAQILERKLSEAENPLGSAALTEVKCERCDTAFVVQEDIPGERAVLVFGERGDESKSCDRDMDTQRASQGKAILGINLIRIARNSKREAAPAVDINPLARNVLGINYIMDPRKAEAMAYAENDFRTKAAYNRGLAREDVELARRRTELEAEGQEVASALNDSTRKLSRKERKSLRHRESEAYVRFAKLTRDESFANEMRRFPYVDDRFTESQLEEDMFKIGRNVADRSVLSHMEPKERALFYDRQAARIGEWAGMLHDHPLSAEFKKAHPGIQFQPKGLVRTENEIEELEHSIRIAENVSYNDTQTAISQALEGPDPWIGAKSEVQRLLHQAADAELDDEYERITGELKTGAKQLDKLHADLVDKVKIQPLRDEVSEKSELLDEVRREVGLLVEDEEAEATA